MSAPTITPKRADHPAWKQFWVDRGFAREMKSDGIIVDEMPPVANKIIQTGPYCMVVVDYRDMSYSHASGIEQLLGYTKETLYEGKFEFLMNILHPEDKEKVL